MRHSSHIGKGNKMLSVIFIFFRSGWFAMLDQSLPVSQSIFSIRYWGALIISIGSIRFCNAVVIVITPMNWMFLMTHIATIWERQQDVVCDFHFLSFSMTCNGRPIIGLFHQALCWCAIAVPLDLIIGSTRYCRAGVDFTTPIKRMYFMTYSSHMGKGNKVLSVILIFFRSGWFAIPDQS